MTTFISKLIRTFVLLVAVILITVNAINGEHQTAAILILAITLVVFTLLNIWQISLELLVRVKRSAESIRKRAEEQERQYNEALDELRVLMEKIKAEIKAKGETEVSKSEVVTTTEDLDNKPEEGSPAPKVTETNE